MHRGGGDPNQPPAGCRSMVQGGGRTVNRREAEEGRGGPRHSAGGGDGALQHACALRDRRQTAQGSLDLRGARGGWAAQPGNTGGPLVVPLCWADGKRKSCVLLAGRCHRSICSALLRAALDACLLHNRPRTNAEGSRSERHRLPSWDPCSGVRERPRICPRPGSHWRPALPWGQACPQKSPHSCLHPDVG